MKRPIYSVLVLMLSMYMFSCQNADNSSGLASVFFKTLDGCEVNQCVYVSLEVTKKNDPKTVLIKPDMVSIDTGAGGDLKREDSPYLFTLAYYSTDKKLTYKNNTALPVDFSQSKDGVLDVEIPVTKQNGSSKGEKQLTAKSEVITKTTVKGVISDGGGNSGKVTLRSFFKSSCHLEYIPVDEINLDRTNQVAFQGGTSGLNGTYYKSTTSGCIDVEPPSGYYCNSITTKQLCATDRKSKDNEYHYRIDVNASLHLGSSTIDQIPSFVTDSNVSYFCFNECAKSGPNDRGKCCRKK